METNKFEERMKGHAQITKSIIPAPFNLKDVINNMEGKNMKKTRNITWLKRVSVIAATVAICAITFVSANSISGFFKDVKRWDGAVVGTEYINATNEVTINVSNIKEENENMVFDLNITFEKENEIPFKFIEEIAVNEYKIVDIDNKEIIKFNTEIDNGLKGSVEEGKAVIEIPIENFNLYNHKIVIDNIYGLAKAEQPLKIIGNWECEF